MDVNNVVCDAFTQCTDKLRKGEMASGEQNWECLRGTWIAICGPAGVPFWVKEGEEA